MQRYFSSMWKQQIIKSLLIWKKRNMQHKIPHQRKSISSHTSHPCTSTHTVPAYAKHSPCLKCACMFESSPASVQRSSERPNSAVALVWLAVCPSHPCLPCDSKRKATRHAHFLYSTPPHPPKRHAMNKTVNRHNEKVKFKDCGRGKRMSCI